VPKARLGTGYDAPATYAKLIAPRYAPIAEALLEAAAPRAKDDALELGAGTGLVTKRTAPRVRSLLATDISPGMLAHARRIVGRKRGLMFALLDYGATFPFLDESFDLVLSGLTYVQNSSEPLKEISRVLRPGGRLALAMWGNGYHEYEMLSDALDSIGRGRFPSPAPGRAARRLERIGFQSIDRKDITLTSRFPSVEHYIAYRRGFGIPLGWTPTTYERFLRSVRGEARKHADTRGRFSLGWTVSIITARRAS
jgi:SAM-dependent methyltransferase